MNINHIVENAKSFENLIIQMISEAENYTRSSRNCPVVSDKEFTLSLIIKTIVENQSGLDFLQKLKQKNIIGLNELEIKIEQASSTFFDNLNSERRSKYVSEIATIIFKSISDYINDQKVDYLKDFTELDGRDVYSGDGHYAKHATHTKKINGKTPCFGAIYVQNIRNGTILPISTIDSDTSSKPNELPILKECLQDFITNHNLNKPILIYDRACIDYNFWTSTEKERENGCTIVTRVKKNTKLILKKELHIDEEDPLNIGILEYSEVELSNAGIMYYVKYQDPETGDFHEFISSDKSLKPSTIVFLYKLRWGIEKVFDVFKNKLNQRKAWATSKAAHQAQAHIIAMTYNLMHMIKINLEKAHDIKELKLINKRIKALEVRKKKAEKNMNQIHPFEFLFNHIYQMSKQFIRTFKNAIFDFLDWNDMIILFKDTMAKYV